MTKRGLFIVIYGINNLGKTTQAELLTNHFIQEGLQAEYLKYPIYGLAPSGHILNQYLRHGNPLRLIPREVQTIYTLNRTQYEAVLRDKLDNGINIIAEDYTGTGICWGIGAGVDKDYLLLINNHLLKEDMAFVFDGQRFTQATEKNHQHETDDILLEKVGKIHLEIGKALNWIKIDANLPIEDIHDIIWQKVKTKL